jgi:hypothetical protein
MSLRRRSVARRPPARIAEFEGDRPGCVYAWLSLLHKALAAKQIQVHGGDRIENDEHQAVLG